MLHTIVDALATRIGCVLERELSPLGRVDVVGVNVSEDTQRHLGSRDTQQAQRHFRLDLILLLYGYRCLILGKYHRERVSGRLLA